VISCFWPFFPVDCENQPNFARPAAAAGRELGGKRGQTTVSLRPVAVDLQEWAKRLAQSLH
jgi:hypothetical protein